MKRFTVIKEFPNYAITRGGQIKRVKKARGTRVGYILKSFPVAGYPAYDLRQTGKRRVVYALRLVAMTFLPNAKRSAWVNHKSANKQNPRVSNLEWTTPKGNTAHAVRTGLSPVGSRCRHSILTTKDVKGIRKRLARGERGCDLATEYEVSRQAVCDINRGRNWKRVV
jgi:hypothetical protein